MAKSDSECCDVPSASEADRLQSETRIDAAHSMSKVEAESSVDQEDLVPTASVSTVEAAETVSLGEQLRTQADQLAAHLRCRQKELDHRESRLNGHLAQLDNDVRAARLFLDQRETELAERTSALETTDQEAENRLARLAAAEAAAERTRREADEEFAKRQEALGQWQEELEAREKEEERVEEVLRYQRQQIDTRREASLVLVRQLMAALERRREAIEGRAARMLEEARKPSPDLLKREEEVRQATQALDGRRQELDEMEALVADARADTEKLREELAGERQKVLELAKAERQRMTTEHCQALAELRKKRESLARRSKHVDTSQAALRQLRYELARMHRETLEIRMATEELWLQLSETAAPEALTRSLGQIRARLADQYRRANQELAEQKRELQTLREQLAQQHAKVVRQKRQLDEWAQGREREIERQAQRLTIREQELEDREAVVNDLARQLQAEQLDCQKEIRQLRAQLHESDTVVAAT